MKNEKRIRKAMVFTVVILALLLTAACGVIDSPFGDNVASGRLAVGEVIQFGDFDWRVLDVQGDRMLIITEYIIERRDYYHPRDEYNRTVDVTWETSAMREYLNNEFLNTFSAADRARILEVTLTNNDNPWFGTDGGNDTTDYIFLLSVEEVVRYFGDSSRLSEGSRGTRLADNVIYDQYDEARMTPYINSTRRWPADQWLLRTPGYTRACSHY